MELVNEVFAGCFSPAMFALTREPSIAYTSHVPLMVGQRLARNA